MKNAVVTALLRTKEERGEVSAADVRDAVRVLGCSERTVWRWVQRGGVPASQRKRWEPDPEYRTLLMRHGGSIADLRNSLAAAGKETVSTRTMQRAFAREYPTALLTFARQGYDAAAAQLPTSRMPDLEVNEEWSMDDTQLPVWCVLPSGRVGKAQMQGIIDGCTRYILSVVVSPYTFRTDDAVENLATAMAGHYTEDGVFIGGKPQALRTDRGSIFVTRATSMGLVTEKIARRYSAPYTPQQNGKIERWHRYKSVFKHLPGFDWSDYKQGDRRKKVEPPAADGLLTFEELAVEVLKAVRHYNTQRVHSAHGLTPQDCWEREVSLNPDLVRQVDGVALRASMRQEDARMLRRRRIEWDNRTYNLHPQSVQDSDEDELAIERRRALIDAAEQSKVTFRYLPDRYQYVSVYNGRGEYLGDAVWDKYQSVAQAGETAQTRRRHINTMTAHLEEIAKRDLIAIAARRQMVLDELEAERADHRQYDAPENEPDIVDASEAEPGTPADPGGRKSRTAKVPSKDKAGGKQTLRERTEAKRRSDATDAATWTRAATG
ncbi:DDE-type integrase/transposase/recombinase [Nocardioides panaciterrulae]|uniref:Transposase InsO family protein n=1 Tax=Nocardioides panaciterrulae TaxID=661492 RepID=A0A7Y9E322_9ACTN|nr:DDE-type integrase/transposase/recombinase [Nocardioides panaciterrulae]NYD40025.1 transposase InsO family protein [Nocardioides panaciterrulae]